MSNRVIALLLTLFCLSLLSISVSADQLPEENPIGETLTVEDDSNIIKENLDKEKEDRPVETEEVISMTEETYLDRCFKPFSILFCAGVAVFLVVETAGMIRRMTDNKKASHE